MIRQAVHKTGHAPRIKDKWWPTAPWGMGEGAITHPPAENTQEQTVLPPLGKTPTETWADFCERVSS